MSKETTTKSQTATLQEPNKANLPALAKPRLPFHPVIQERFGVDRAMWKALCESIFPLARTTDAIILALAYCKARNLDIMKRPCHIVPMWNSALHREVETVWPSIAELRTTAFRTGQYAGADVTDFGPNRSTVFKGKTRAGKNKAAQELTQAVTYPEYAQITVYRFVMGHKVSFPGPRIYYTEAFGYRKGAPVPNEKWSRSPSYMLEKVAEAAALRKAFPEELGNQQAAEEMEDRIVSDVQNQMAPRPDRADYEASGTPQDGVVVEPDDEDDDKNEPEDTPPVEEEVEEEDQPTPQQQVEQQHQPVEEEPEEEVESPDEDQPPSAGFMRGSEYIDALESQLNKGAIADIETFKKMGRQQIDVFTDITDEERDMLRGRFSTIVLTYQRNRQKRGK